MYKKISPKRQKTSIHRNTSFEGESIEAKVRRIQNNKEPIKDGAPLIYTERKHGVHPEMNIRTDRFELAVEAKDIVTKNHIAKRDGVGQAAEPQETKNDGKAEPIHVTGSIAPK